jgi:hypothetical protein
MRGVKSKEKTTNNKKIKKRKKIKIIMVSRKMKWTMMNPIWCQMKKRSPFIG